MFPARDCWPERDANGVIQVPTGPGFGVDIDPDFISKATIVKG